MMVTAQEGFGNTHILDGPSKVVQDVPFESVLVFVVAGFQMPIAEKLFNLAGMCRIIRT
ncbi:hypothetical protein GGI1_11723 [Acidithiobacillus sp. GGI-221]|nr:hypothetical protein GGI1_11723 [Acidithiobacillus sp. GGI-221]